MDAIREISIITGILYLLGFLAGILSIARAVDDPEYLRKAANNSRAIKIALLDKERVIFLSINHKQLTEIPEAIKSFPNLKELDLSSNKIKKIPNWLGNLKTLEVLDISHNEISKIPESLSNLESLIELDLKDNPINKADETKLRATFKGKLLLGYKDY